MCACTYTHTHKSVGVGGGGGEDHSVCTLESNKSILPRFLKCPTVCSNECVLISSGQNKLSSNFHLSITNIKPYSVPKTLQRD